MLLTMASHGLNVAEITRAGMNGGPDLATAPRTGLDTGVDAEVARDACGQRQAHKAEITACACLTNRSGMSGLGH
jgi:hypothetical protein